MRDLTRLLPFVLALGCGGGKKEAEEAPPTPPAEETPAPPPAAEPTPDAAPPQSLGEGTAALCKAPERAEADPAYKDAKDDAAKHEVLNGKLKEGVTNQEVLDFIASTEGMKGEGEKMAKLKEFAKKAQVTDCPLIDAWKPGKAKGKGKKK